MRTRINDTLKLLFNAQYYEYLGVSRLGFILTEIYNKKKFLKGEEIEHYSSEIILWVINNLTDGVNVDAEWLVNQIGLIFHNLVDISIQLEAYEFSGNLMSILDEIITLSKL